jgi:hypothetical protein
VAASKAAVAPPSLKSPVTKTVAPVGSTPIASPASTEIAPRRSNHNLCPVAASYATVPQSSNREPGPATSPVTKTRVPSGEIAAPEAKSPECRGSSSRRSHCW